MDAPPKEKGVASRLAEMNHRAQRWLSYVDSCRTARSIEAGQLSSHSLSVPIESSAVSFNEEGVETLPKGSEAVELPGLDLPAQEVGWDRQAGNYRVWIETTGSATLTAKTPGGKTLAKNRKTAGIAILDLRSGRARISARGAAISRVQLSRHSGRARGSVVIGPLKANGVVSAEAVGHGDWTATVASDYEVGASVDDNGLRLWPGEAIPKKGLQESGWLPWGLESQREKEPIPWHLARRFQAGRGLDSPSYGPEVEAGRVYLSSELTEQTTFSLEEDHPSDFWTGLASPWAPSSEIVAPLFDETAGYWAFVWGTASGPSLVKAIDARTGAPVSKEVLSSRSGEYLVKAAGPSLESLSFEVDGVMCRYGEPMRLGSDPLTAAHNNRTPYLRESLGQLHVFSGDSSSGPTRRLRYRLSPERFLIKLEGKGLLKAVDITVEDTSGSPLATPNRKVYREQLSQYKDPHSIWSRQRQGRGPRAAKSFLGGGQRRAASDVA